MTAEKHGKTAPCSKCGTVKRVYEAGVVVAKNAKSGEGARTRWLCLDCYKSAINP